MPRPGPGPRPYECVKRAWHSDRHHPMRGSLIQRILRIATQVHKPETREKTEWQTKLPHVIIKAEQILYSKANSEVEYMNADTLWERLNEAVDIIIRRDENENTEDGNFIRPCIEAALILGCVPVKESRSQQLKNPRKYLTGIIDEAPKFGQHSGAGGRGGGSGGGSGGGTSNNQMPPPSRPPKHPNNQQSTKLRSPLYYGSHPENVLFGRPVSWPVTQPPCVPTTMNLLPGYTGENIDVGPLQPADDNSHGNHAVEDCDLSLRLGPSAVMEKCGSDGQQEFCFFPCSFTAARHVSQSSNDDEVEIHGKLQNSEACRKRKVPEFYGLD